MEAFSGNKPGTGGLVTFKDSSWFMSIVLPHQPHFVIQTASVTLSPHQTDVAVHWRRNIARTARPFMFPIRFGVRELHLHSVPASLHHQHVHAAHERRSATPRPGEFQKPRVGQPVRRNSRGRVFTVEYSVRVAQMAVYALLGIEREIPPILHHDKSLRVNFESVVKAFK